MIDLLEGIPGSGKSYEAVVFHVLPALKKGRKVVTNLPLNVEAFAKLDARYPDLLDIRKEPRPILGRWDAEAAGRGESCFVLGDFEQPKAVKVTQKIHGMNVQVTGVLDDENDRVVGEFEGRPSIKAPAGTPLFGHVWDFYDDWRGEGNQGPLYIIDECHVSFPKENVRKGRGTPDNVIQWFKLSRHFGADILLMTQRMNALEPDIAELAQHHIRVMKALFLGKKDEYVRKVFAGYRGGEVQVNIRQYKSQYFHLYQSHTQGSTVIEAAPSDLDTKYVRLKKFNRIFYVVTALACVYAGYKILHKPDNNEHAKAFKAAAHKTPEGHKLLGVAPDGSPISEPYKPPTSQQAMVKSREPEKVSEASQESAKEPEKKDPEPLEGKGVHIVGWALFDKKKLMHSIVLSKDGRTIADIKASDLVQAGYEYQPLAECMAYLSWKGQKRAVTCDAPRVASGTDSKPVVIEDPAARYRAGAQHQSQAMQEEAEYRPPQYQQHATMADISKVGRTARLVDSGRL